MELDSQSKESDIVLFYPAHKDFLKLNVLDGLDGLDFVVFDPRKDVSFNLRDVIKSILENIKTNPALLFKSFFSVRDAKFFLKKNHAIYIAYQLRKFKPKVVLTCIDNSPIFHLVCQAYNEIIFIAIQNGGRYIWCADEALPDPRLKYHINEYYCFGPYVEDLFKKYGHKIDRFVTCGSPIGGVFFSEFLSANETQSEKYDICLISQYVHHHRNINSLPRRWRNLPKSIDIFTSLVARYARENNSKVCIALRSNDVSEQDYYNKYFNGVCCFQKSNRVGFSSYHAVIESRLNISLNSTLGTEAFGAGLKTLFVNPLSEEWLKPTRKLGVWCIDGTNYDHFSERTSELLNMNIKEYLECSLEERNYSMSYDFDEPLHKRLRARLLEIVDT
mgnify:CR=1 FL=1